MIGAVIVCLSALSGSLILGVLVARRQPSASLLLKVRLGLTLACIGLLCGTASMALEMFGS